MFTAFALNLQTISILDFLDICLGFLIFSLIASGTYLINDIIDIENDKNHPTKMKRPIASGKLSIQLALKISCLLIGLSLLASFYLLPISFFIICLTYLTTTFLYSFFIKKAAVLDVLCLAALFTIRVYGGSYIISKEISPWFSTFVFLFFLSLALAKRAIELNKREDLIGENDVIPGRGYIKSDLSFIFTAGVSSSLFSILILLIYSFLDISSVLKSPIIALLMCLGLLWWSLRLWLLVQRKQIHFDPVIFCIKDKASRIFYCFLGALVLIQQIYL